MKLTVSLALAFALIIASPMTRLVMSEKVLEIDVLEVLGALETGEHNSAGVEKDFLCSLGSFGLTTDSHETISNSGKQTLHCRGEKNKLETPVCIVGLPCGFFFGGMTNNSRLLITPGGEIILSCKEGTANLSRPKSCLHQE